MAISSRNKINVSFSMAGMSDVVFLLLIFFMLTSTLIVQHALELTLPQSTNQVEETPVVKVIIDKNQHFFVEKEQVFSDDELESKLVEKLKYRTEPVISLWADEKVPLFQVVKVMNIAKDNRYKLILATQQEPPKEKEK
jgi:biopolymer transport protein ExbD